MKRIVLILIMVWFALAGWSQTVEIYLKNGQKEDYDASTIDRIVFSDSGNANQGGKDDGEVPITEANIVGEWEVIYSDVDAAFGTVDKNQSVGSKGYFYSDGTWKDKDDYGTWTLKENVLTMYTKNKLVLLPSIYTVVSLTRNTIELRLDYGYLAATVKMKRIS